MKAHEMWFCINITNGAKYRYCKKKKIFLKQIISVINESFNQSIDQTASEMTRNE